MTETKILLDPHKVSEKPMRNILGMNNIPRMVTLPVQERETRDFNALNLKHIRFHDAPMDNPGFVLVDIHRIFPLFHQNETDPRNYVFGQTDDYMAPIANSNAEIDFRLGETIDHSLKARMIAVPEDIEKWARVCRNIIGHYKNGEMDGMYLNITRVSVWEEANNAKLFAGTVEDFAEMFCAVYRLLKRDFPDIKVGGPAVTAKGTDFMDQFITLCKAQNVTPDFLSGTHYHKSLEVFEQKLAPYFEILKKHGLENTPLSIVEWHYGVSDWAKESYVSENGFDSAESAAFSTALLTYLMDLEQIDVAYYYSWGTYHWAVYNRRADGFPLLPVYYGLQFFQRLATECPQRLQVTVESPAPVKVLAGKTEVGMTRLLVSCFDCEDQTISITCPGMKHATLTAVSTMQEQKISVQKGAFTFDHAGRHDVYLLEFYS